MTTRLTDEQIEALRQKAIKWMHPITEEEVIALIDEVRASRSSSGSGERDRVRALEEALSVIETEVSMFLDEDDGQVARLHTVLNVIRALSPQGDGGTDRG